MTELRAWQDTWLSTCLGLPCFGAGPDGEENLEVVTAQANPVFITAKIGQGEIKTQALLENLGFLEINQQMTFRCTPSKTRTSAQPDQIKFVAGPAQELGEPLANFADVFTKDRFHRDTRLPRYWSPWVKTQWITAPDSGKQIVMANINHHPAGFALLQPREHHAVIDLIAVAPSYQGQGVGRQLLAHLQNVVCKNQEIVVGTQHDNYAARRLYTSAGFECSEIKKVYHFYSEG